MIKIYRSILSIYKEKLLDSSDEFKKGFWACSVMLQKGIKKSINYNLQVKIDEQEREIKRIKREVQGLSYQLEDYKTRLRKKELVSLTPLLDYHSYLMETNIGSFTLVINCTKETIMLLWFRFLSSASYNSSDECKSKFLSYLKGMNSKGFRAFKDIKTAKKEIGYDTKHR